ncbi:MAG TPA: GspH/FimT family protein [Atribacteraceae bacterium]|nr:GspH/FimT family protein [Atribacteraceae bacterium]
MTLLELLVVVAVMGLLGLISIPSLRSLQVSLLNRVAARQVASQVRSAKAEALRRGEPVRVTFDTFHNRIIYRIGTAPSSAHPLPATVDLYHTNFPANRLFFHPTGTPTSGGTVTLRTGGKLLYVIIVPVTGRVRISVSPP